MLLLLIPHHPSGQGRKSGCLFSLTLLFLTFVGGKGVQKTWDTEWNTKPVAMHRTSWILRNQTPSLRLFTRLLAMRKRILKTWLSFHYYAVCLSYVTFSQEKWIRETLLHLFVVHFNSELRGEHKKDPSTEHKCNPFPCFDFVKSLHRDTQVSVASIIARIPSMNLFEWRGK